VTRQERMTVLKKTQTPKEEQPQPSNVQAILSNVRLGGVVVRALDLRLEIAGSIPAAALSSAPFGILFTRIYICHQAV